MLFQERHVILEGVESISSIAEILTNAVVAFSIKQLREVHNLIPLLVNV